MPFVALQDFPNPICVFLRPTFDTVRLYSPSRPLAPQLPMFSSPCFPRCSLLCPPGLPNLCPFVPPFAIFLGLLHFYSFYVLFFRAPASVLPQHFAFLSLPQTYVTSSCTFPFVLCPVGAIGSDPSNVCPNFSPPFLLSPLFRQTFFHCSSALFFRTLLPLRRQAPPCEVI